MLSTRTTSRLASVCPSASMRALSRARIMSPRPAWLPSESVISASPTLPSSTRRSRTSAASRAAVSFDVASSRASLPVQEPVQVQRRPRHRTRGPGARGRSGRGQRTRPARRYRRARSRSEASASHAFRNRRTSREPVRAVPRGDQAEDPARVDRPELLGVERGHHHGAAPARYLPDAERVLGGLTCVASSITRTSPG